MRHRASGCGALPDPIHRHDLTAIIPTVGRPRPLERSLRSLAAQSVLPAAVIVVHSGHDAETVEVCRRRFPGLTIEYCHSTESGAALQRDFAIRRVSTPLLLMCEDDVEFEPDWVATLLRVVESDAGVGAAMGRITNQPFLSAPGIWRLYRRLVASPWRAEQPGAVLGALVANGFPQGASAPVPSEWLGGGMSLMRREAYLSVGGFAPHFRGSSPGEDVDLGYRISRKWRIYYVPEARCVHHQEPGGREAVGRHQYLSMRSRFAFCRTSRGLGVARSFMHIGLWALVQTMSEVGQLRRGRLRPDFGDACAGRLRGAWSCVGWDPSAERFPHWDDVHAGV